MNRLDSSHFLDSLCQFVNNEYLNTLSRFGFNLSSFLFMVPLRCGSLLRLAMTNYEAFIYGENDIIVMQQKLIMQCDSKATQYKE